MITVLSWLLGTVGAGGSKKLSTSASFCMGRRAYINCVLKRTPFVVPSGPVQKQQPPPGPKWLHEVKFDGFRAQLHKHGDDVTI